MASKNRPKRGEGQMVLKGLGRPHPEDISKIEKGEGGLYLYSALVTSKDRKPRSEFFQESLADLSPELQRTLLEAPIDVTANTFRVQPIDAGYALATRGSAYTSVEDGVGVNSFMNAHPASKGLVLGTGFRVCRTVTKLLSD